MQQKSGRRPNALRSEEMRSRLIAAARALFVEKGYAETGTPEIVSRAKVTRGALYHHFADKADLFRAVVRAEAGGVEAEIEGATEGVGPTEAMEAGTRAYFAAMAVPGRSRLLLIEGPAVLGVAEMDAIHAGSSRSSLADGLAAMLPAVSEDEIERLAIVLSAAFDRAAFAVSEGADLEGYVNALMRLISGLVPRS